MAPATALTINRPDGDAVSRPNERNAALVSFNATETFEQRDDDLLWARDRFLADRRKCDHVVVHGHTPVDTPYPDRRRTCVDTGAYATSGLSAAKFEGESVTFLIVE